MFRTARIPTSWMTVGPGTQRRRTTMTAARVVLTLLVVAVMIVPTTIIATHWDGLPAGTSVGNVAVGGMSMDDAVSAVEQRLAELADTPVMLSLAGQEISARPDELGLRYDATGALAALAETRLTHGFGRGQAYPVDVALDTDQLNAYLLTLADHMVNPARNAAVSRSDDGRFVVTPGARGQSIDLATTQAAIVDQAEALTPITVAVALTDGDPLVTDANAQRAADLANAASQGSYSLVMGDQQVTVDGAEIARSITFTAQPDGQLVPGVDVGLLEPALAPAIAELESSDPVDAYIAEGANVSWLIASEPGLTIDRLSLFAQIETSLTSGNRIIQLQGEVTPAAITTDDELARLGITDVIGTGTSIYAGSGAGRQQNIEAAAFHVDGTLVPPGGTYSFNDSVGSLFDGRFTTAGAYIDGPDGQSLGGGVCQVSTTVFRAALAAGFPVTEWHPHTYRSSFYELGGWEPGYDAAIVQDGNNPEWSTDLKFFNPTESWLYVKVTTTDGELRVDIMGAPTGWQVDVSEPSIELLEYAPTKPIEVVDEALPPGTSETTTSMDGLRVTVYRTVRDADGNVLHEESFVSEYGAYGGIRRVSPDMASGS